MTNHRPVGAKTDESRLPTALAHAWGLERPTPRRGPKARLSVEQIVESALELADARGRQGHSLSSVAERLGVTTNAMYRYVSSRAELDVLLSERALGGSPNLPPDAAWQDAVKAWVHALRDRHRAHPWLVDVQTHAPLMPNVLAWLDALLQVLTNAGLEPPRAMSVASVIDGYVRAVAVRERELGVLQSEERALWAAPPVVAKVAALSRSRGLHHAAFLLENAFFASESVDGDADFVAGLDLILMGLDQEMTNR